MTEMDFVFEHESGCIASDCLALAPSSSCWLQMTSFYLDFDCCTISD